MSNGLQHKKPEEKNVKRNKSGPILNIGYKSVGRLNRTVSRHHTHVPRLGTFAAIFASRFGDGHRFVFISPR